MDRGPCLAGPCLMSMGRSWRWDPPGSCLVSPYPRTTVPQVGAPQLCPTSGAVRSPCSVPTFTVVPEAQSSPSPLMVVDEEDEPTEGVPIEQYRAWLGKH